MRDHEPTSKRRIPKKGTAVPFVRIEGSTGFISLNGRALQLLDEPKFLRFLWDAENSALCIAATAIDGYEVLTVPKRKQKSMDIRIRRKKFVDELLMRFGWAPDRTYKILADNTVYGDGIAVPRMLRFRAVNLIVDGGAYD